MIGSDRDFFNVLAAISNQASAIRVSTFYLTADRWPLAAGRWPLTADR
ncbi:MAG: hypothetical protein JW751_20265 [Polyangiaceae bacterium]|nr:hypothetical protein [Polyangiaceae bacterium]